MTDARVRPVILCGGGGTRLWPLSRRDFPKQFLTLFGDASMLQQTVGRVARPDYAAPLFVTGEDQRFLVQQHVAAAGAQVAAILLEPTARNTAPAIALAAHWAAVQGEDLPMLVLPSDHRIEDPDAMAEAVAAALPGAVDGGIVTFGITPSGPQAGFGYIEAEADASGSGALRPVRRFVEKPDRTRAEALLAAGALWNSGIFLVRPSVYLAELERLAPEIASATARAMQDAVRDGAFVRPAAEAFAASPSTSIDYAVMERTDRAFVQPVSLRWSDVGSWSAVHEQSEVDAQGNRLVGDVVALDTTGSLVHADGRKTVATIGLKDVMVIATDDAVLVAPLSEAQRTREVVEELQRQGRDTQGPRAVVHRPWGTYQQVDAGPNFQTKRIVVRPGASLSLQRHRHRAEHWVVVAGLAEVQVGDTVERLGPNQSTHIPAGALHRLSNPGSEPLHLIEVQCGDYLGEDDIERFDDAYGR